MSCEAEQCPYWGGHGCVCDVMDIPDDERKQAQEALRQQLEG